MKRKNAHQNVSLHAAGGLRPSLVLLAIAGLIAVTGCQPDGSAPPALSLEEARKVTASFDSQSFVPPPRSITDITAILDQQQRSKSKKTERRDALADGTPPQGASRKKLSKFYKRRGSAARKIGRVRQAIDDLTTAFELSDQLRPRARAKILDRLSVVENLGGRRINALRHLRQAIRMNDKSARAVLWTARLAKWLVNTGDLAGAAAALDDAESEMSRISSSNRRGARRAWHKHGLRMQSMIIRARAAHLEKSGSYAEAETYLRSAFAKLIRANDQ
ncbi:MAG: hypothetical protein ACTSQV_06140, partial [Alphaproteobacteria bacterium]